MNVGESYAKIFLSIVHPILSYLLFTVTEVIVAELFLKRLMDVICLETQHSTQRRRLVQDSSRLWGSCISCLIKLVIFFRKLKRREEVGLVCKNQKFLQSSFIVEARLENTLSLFSASSFSHRGLCRFNALDKKSNPNSIPVVSYNFQFSFVFQIIDKVDHVNR